MGGVTSPGIARLDAVGGNESVNVVTISMDFKKIGVDQATTVATVTLTRTGNLSQPLTVDYTTGGLAVSGVDYQPLPGQKTIKAGRSSATFNVIATKPGDEATGAAAVKITLAAGAGYVVGDPAAAKIKIVR